MTTGGLHISEWIAYPGGLHISIGIQKGRIHRGIRKWLHYPSTSDLFWGIYAQRAISPHGS